MTTQHVTMSLLTCLLLIGLSSASLLRDLEMNSAPRLSEVERNHELWRSAIKEDNKTVQQAPLYDPPQCLKFKCPPSEVVFEKATYKAVYFPVAKYAKLRLEGETLVPAFFKLYKELRGYFEGNNKNNRKLRATAPLILRVDPGDDMMFSPKNFTLFFYIDPKDGNPPAPTNPNIEVLDVNAYSLYIRTFSSYPVVYADWMREMLQLAADVEADDNKYFKGYYYFALYDQPFEMTGRVNEVQLLRKSLGDD